MGVLSSAMHSSLKSLDHRPWPLPAREWKWRQSWLDLAFIHYRVPADQLRRLLPVGIQLQEFDGTAWVGLVPFRMAGVMRRPWPDIPFISSFSEMNLRTYVEVGGKPGVWFFSLDANSRSIVFGGRNFYGLPYFLARMRQRYLEHGLAHVTDRWEKSFCPSQLRSNTGFRSATVYIRAQPARASNGWKSIMHRGCCSDAKLKFPNAVCLRQPELLLL